MQVECHLLYCKQTNSQCTRQLLTKFEGGREGEEVTRVRVGEYQMKLSQMISQLKFFQVWKFFMHSVTCHC